MSYQEPYNLDRTVRLVINCVIFIGVVWLVNVLKGVLLPFFVGCHCLSLRAVRSVQP